MNKRVDTALNLLECGNITISPFVVSESGEMIFGDYSFYINDTENNFSLKAGYNGIFSDALYFTCNGDELTCRRLFENISETEQSIREIGVLFKKIDFEQECEDDYFYHNENPRLFGYMTLPIDFDRKVFEDIDGEFDEMAGNNWADPGVSFDRIGNCPYQPFPALLLSNYNTKKGLVHGSLSQRIFYHNYTASHGDEGLNLCAYSSFKAIGKLRMESGRILQDEWYLGATDNADDIEKIFEKYTAVLRKKLPTGYGRTAINRDNMVWGSWNDGIFRDVSEEMLLREAKYLKENFPTVKWIQLDDGYSVYTKHSHGLGVPYEGEEGIDKNKFPKGLRSYTEKIREIGLRPAVWIGGFCPIETKIYKENPDWFFDYWHRVDFSQPLDVSKETVRKYMTSALDTLILRDGFEGVKQDFWSYAFEDSNDLLENQNKSGYEHRDWWLKEIRKRIPTDGYLQTGCDIAMANPFLGEYFTNYRYGIDIASGDWHNVKLTYLWGIACFALHTGDLFVPNSDSIGMLPGLSDDEAYFCINYCLATHSMVEISGILSKAEHNDRYRMLKKAACNPNNGQDIYFVNYDYRVKGDDFVTPDTIYFKTPHFSVVENGECIPLRTVAMFNIREEKKTISFNASEIGLEKGEYILTDVWSGEQFDLTEEAVFTINPHASRLLAVSKKDGLQLYDANIRINSSKVEKNGITLETDYAVKDVELFLSHKVKSIRLNDKKIGFTQKGSSVFFDAEEKGILEIEM